MTRELLLGVLTELLELTLLLFTALLCGQGQLGLFKVFVPKFRREPVASLNRVEDLLVQIIVNPSQLVQLLQTK